MAANKPFIKFDTTTMVDVITAQNIDRSVTIFAEPGARLRRITTTGPIITIANNADVTIFDLQIREGAGNNGHAIDILSEDASVTLDRVFLLDNAGRGVNAAQGTKLTMRRCVVSNNDEGGISMQDMAFDISNTLVVLNGDSGSPVGGVRVTGPEAGSTFLFNTVADNQANVPAAGVDCNNAFTANSNIVANNGMGAACPFSHTLFENVTLPGGGTTGNLSGDPNFDIVNSTMATSPRYYRINRGSMAIDNADPAATIVTDIDGDARPAGDADMGADEVAP